MDWWVELVQKIDVANLLVMAGMLWFVYSRLSKKIEAIDSKLGSRIDGQANNMTSLESKLCSRMDTLESRLGGRIDKLQETVTDIDRRLCRLEGAFQSKDCCFLKSDSQIKKVD